MHDRTRMLPISCQVPCKSCMLARLWHSYATEGPQWGPGEARIRGPARSAARGPVLNIQATHHIRTAPKEPLHEPLHARTAQRRGQVSASKREGRRPKKVFGIVRTKNGVVHPKRDERERKGTRRLGIQSMHAHRAAISGNQWQSDAINGNRAAISGPHSQSRCNQWPSVALDAPVLG